MSNDNPYNQYNSSPQTPVYGSIDSAPQPAAPGARTPIQYAVSSPARSAGSGIKTFFLLFLVFLLFGSILFNCLFLGAGIVSLSDNNYNNVKESTYSGNWLDSDKIAIINIDGTIIDGEDYRDQIDKAAEDDSVKAVVLRVNSPGGTISGSDYIYHKLCELSEEKPLVVSMGSLAASGGYYVSMAVGHEKDVIFAEPTTWTGSIGVIISRYDASDLFHEKLGVKNDPIKSGTMKGMGSMMEPLTDEQRKVLQDLVDDSFLRFKNIIKSGRKRFEKDPQALDKLATGQVYSTSQALKLGLVDQEGFLDDAIARAMELANISSAHVVEYVEKTTFMDSLLSGQAKVMENANPLSDLRFLMDAATPRAYYLWTAK